MPTPCGGRHNGKKNAARAKKPPFPDASRAMQARTNWQNVPNHSDGRHFTLDPGSARGMLIIIA